MLQTMPPTNWPETLTEKLRALTQCEVLCIVTGLLLACACPGANAAERSDTWHVADATLRFRIERDDGYAPVPDVHLRELRAKKGHSNLKKAISKGGWSGRYYRVGGKRYKRAIAVSAGSTIVYKCSREYGRFVALAGLSDRAGQDATARFEVHADERRLYKSDPLARHIAPVDINVRIPSGAKELKLVTNGSKLSGRRAVWVNAGFLLKGQHPNVGLVKLYTPGYEPTIFEPVVCNTAGDRVSSRVLSTAPGEPLRALFDSSQGSSLYYVYLVRKHGDTSADSAWRPVSAWPSRSSSVRRDESQDGPKAGLILETRHSPQIDPKCHKLPGLLEVWDTIAEPVGRDLVHNIHHAFPIHAVHGYGPADTAKKDGLAIYRYIGFIETKKAGKYTFATASNWGSYVLVDGKPVVSWPGKHSYRAGIRGQKKGRISLKPGIHKLEYLNYSPWGRMLTLAAWQKPRGKLAVITRSDFLPIRRYVATDTEHKEPATDAVSFAWQTVDDWRAGRKLAPKGRAALVRVRFNVITPRQPRDNSYRWKYDDGTIETGPTVEHVFLRPGMRTLTLEVLNGQEVVGNVTHKIHAHVFPDKIYLDPADPNTFEKAISECDFAKVPVGDLVNVYTFADALKRPAWKQRATATLTTRIDELVAESENWGFCFELGEHLRSAAVQQYENGLRLFTRLGERSARNKRVRQRAMVCQAELLTQCFGKAQQAMEILSDAARPSGASNQVADKQMTYRLRMAQAETLIALGKTQLAPQGQATEILQNLQMGSGETGDAKQRIKHMGMLRRARLLVDNANDSVQVDYAAESIERILSNEPLSISMPAVNLVRLDIHLARKEYLVAFHLAERLEKLGFGNRDRLEVLVRKVKALCAMQQVEQAKAVYESMESDFPHNPATAEAKQAIVEAVLAGGEARLSPK
jgi:hypothetical protein